MISEPRRPRETMLISSCLWRQVITSQIASASRLELKQTIIYFTLDRSGSWLGSGAYDRFFMCMEATYHTITTHHFTCIEVCCYGIDLGTSIVRFSQSEHSIWCLCLWSDGLWTLNNDTKMLRETYLIKIGPIFLWSYVITAAFLPSPTPSMALGTISVRWHLQIYYYNWPQCNILLAE